MIHFRADTMKVRKYASGGETKLYKNNKEGAIR